MTSLPVQTAALVLLYVLGSAESRQSALISSRVWKGHIKACNDTGPYSKSYHFKLPTLNTTGMSYEDFDQLTAVIAVFGTLETTTKDVQIVPMEQMILYTFEYGPSYKKYSGRFGYTATCRRAVQAASCFVVLKVTAAGRLSLDTYVYATSWGADTCAVTTVNIAKLRVLY